MRNPSKNTIKRLKKKYPDAFLKKRQLDFERAKALLWWESVVKWADKMNKNIKWEN